MNSVKIPKIRINAECQRLLWLNLNIGLIAGALLINALFYAAVEDQRNYRFVATIGIIVSALIGSVLLERSMRQDFRNNLFDQLRMSSLSPWQMAYSRVLAAPVLAWVIFAVNWLALVVLSGGEDTFSRWDCMALPPLAWATACALLANAVQHNRAHTQWSGALVQLVLLYMAVHVFMMDVGWLYAYFIKAISSHTVLGERNWSGSWLHFASNSVLLAVFASIGLNAAMAQRMHLRPAGRVFTLLALASPLLVWQILFILPATAAVVLSQCWGICAILSFAMQDNTPERFKRIPAAFKSGSLKNIADALPAWVVLLPLSFIAAVAALGMDSASTVTLMLPGYGWLAVFGAAMLLAPRIRIGSYNRITTALAAYLLLRWLVGLF